LSRLAAGTWRAASGGAKLVFCCVCDSAYGIHVLQQTACGERGVIAAAVGYTHFEQQTQRASRTHSVKSGRGAANSIHEAKTCADAPHRVRTTSANGRGGCRSRDRAANVAGKAGSGTSRNVRGTAPARPRPRHQAQKTGTDSEQSSSCVHARLRVATGHDGYGQRLPSAAQATGAQIRTHRPYLSTHTQSVGRVGGAAGPLSMSCVYGSGLIVKDQQELKPCVSVQILTTTSITHGGVEKHRVRRRVKNAWVFGLQLSFYRCSGR
jgi:hypothetical protein